MRIIAAMFLALMFSSCCLPRSINKEQAEKIGLSAVESFCQNHRTKPVDYKLIEAKSEAYFLNPSKHITWMVNFISSKHDGSPDIEIVVLVDRCGHYETSFWDYSRKD
jgi:hypothetical protein